MTDNRSRRTSRKKQDPGVPPPEQAPAPGASTPQNLTESIQMLVALMRAVQAHIDEDMTLRELLHLADTQGKNTTRLAALLKAQNSLQPQDDFARLLNKTIQEVLDEIRGENGGGPMPGPPGY
jgi:hypothetical protein